MQRKVPDAVSGVEDNDLAAVSGQLAKLPDVRAPDPDRFARSVRMLAETRAQSDWPKEGADDAAVFVLVQSPRQVGQTYGAQAFVDPIAKNDPLLGRLFFATRDASAGRVMELPVSDPNEILDWLFDNGLAECPVVIVYRNAKKMVTRRSGIDDIGVIDPIRDQPPSVTISGLAEALRQFHANHLVTPVNCPVGVWKQGRESQYVPGPRPEKSIQAALEIQLNSWFQGLVKAEHEDATEIGRIDVRLLVIGESRGSWAYWVIMELKVIKSFTSTENNVTPNTNIDAIRKGIRQASAFQESRKTETGLLEVFDLRRDKSEDLMEDERVEDQLQNVKPVPDCRIWPMFGSSEDARVEWYSQL